MFSFHRPTLADGLGLLFSVSLKRRFSTLFSLFLGSFGKCPVRAVHISGDEVLRLLVTATATFPLRRVMTVQHCLCAVVPEYAGESAVAKVAC